MSSKTLELYELTYREACESARRLRFWQIKLHVVKKRVDLEEAGQGKLDLEDDPE